MLIAATGLALLPAYPNGAVFTGIEAMLESVVYPAVLPVRSATSIDARAIALRRAARGYGLPPRALKIIDAASRIDDLCYLAALQEFQLLDYILLGR